jgi:hypothetical protein
MDSERTLTVETGPPRKPRYRLPAANACAPEMRRAAGAGATAEVGCAAEMHSATHPRTAAEVSTPAEMASAAPAVTSASSASSWSRISGARQNGRQNNNGEDFDV